MKICSTCKISQSEAEFYKDKRTPDGLKYQCKTCHLKTSIKTRNENLKRITNKKYMQQARSRNIELFREREKRYSRIRQKDDKYRARYALNAAIKKGVISKPGACEECRQKRRLTAHHEDYLQPLNVRWLCYECHGKKHRKSS